MAGVKGRSGGPRKNAGGPRPGAGRPKSPAPKLGKKSGDGKYDDPRDFLLAVVNDTKADPRLRVEAAKQLLPYVHQKKGESGKKEERQGAAKKAGSGKFAPAASPKIVGIR